MNLVKAKDKYLVELSRYIHLNPVRIKKYSQLEIEEKRRILKGTHGAAIAVIPTGESASLLFTIPRFSIWRVGGTVLAVGGNTRSL